MARIVSTTTAGVPTDPTGGMTLDALMARQKELADRASTIAAPRNMQSPWQGAAMLAQSFVNSREEAQTADQLTAGRDELSKLKAGINLDTGPTSEQIAAADRIDPNYADALTAMAFKLREEQKTRDATLAAEQAKAGAAGAWKPTDIAARADDYTKAAATYDTAAPSWQSMQDAAKTAIGQSGPNVGSADLNLVVGLAKILDPNSVVREGESESVKKTGGAADYLVSYYNQLVQGGALTDDIRRGIMNTGQSRMKAYYDQAKVKRDWISSVAARHGVNPDDVVPPLAAFSPFTEAAQPDDPNNPDPNKPPPPPAEPPRDLTNAPQGTVPRKGDTMTDGRGTFEYSGAGDPNDENNWKKVKGPANGRTGM
jgi:hypothetical protein